MLPPVARVAGVRLLAVGIGRPTLAVDLCVSNPNDRAYAVREAELAVAVAGAPFATGRSLAPAVLPAHGSTLVPFAVAVAPPRPGVLLLDALSAGAVAYRVHGTIRVSALPFPVSFDHVGEVGLPALGARLLAGADPAPAGCAMAATSTSTTVAGPS